MALDTFTVLVGISPDVESAEADYDLVLELPHRGAADGWLRRRGRPTAATTAR